MSDDLLRLEVPARSEHLRLVRLLVASVATAHGADLDDLEDLRIATGEICAALVDGDDPARLVVEVDVVVDGDRPTVRLRAGNDPAGEPVELDELSAMVLETTADDAGTGDAPWAGGSGTRGAWMQRSIRAGAAARAADDG
jgi:serine/threonine-protein kinase RsbW